LLLSQVHVASTVLVFVWHCLQDLLDATFDVRAVPLWLSSLLTVLFVASTVGTAMLVTDLGAVLHMIGGTVSSTLRGWCAVAVVR
jgi:hypothetical protein